MRSRYLGKINFSKAMSAEREALERVRDTGDAEVLGFECEPVITLGKRAARADLIGSSESLKRFEVVTVDRGGQATLHNPGQLVIFPICSIRERGVRAWVGLLLATTERTLAEFGCEARCRSGQPGLYTSLGKIASVGLRIEDGISTHGVSLNICNDLSDFDLIRACGVAGAAVDRLGHQTPSDVFAVWMKFFKDELTTSQNLTNLECSSRDVRL